VRFFLETEAVDKEGAVRTDIPKEGLINKVLAQAVWSRQFGETEHVPAPKLPDLYRKPSMLI